MSIIFLLIPVSILIAACFLGAFIWAVRSGQYEDTCTPAMRLLLEEQREPNLASSPRSGERAGVRGASISTDMPNVKKIQ